GSGAGRGGRRGRGGLGLGPPAEPGRAAGHPPCSRRRRSGTGAGSGQRAGPPGRGAPAGPPGASRRGCAAPARLGPTGPQAAAGRAGRGRSLRFPPQLPAVGPGPAGVPGLPSPRLRRGQEPSRHRLPLHREGRGHGKQILVLGLDGAGKTSILHSLATNHVKRSVAPTEGFNAICVNTEESQMEFLEIGGSESLRSYWKMYLPKVLLLIYVVDSADHARLPVAKQLLHQLIQNNSTLPVVVLANKQDLEGAYCITDIHDALALSDIGDERKMFLIGTHVAEDGSEISSSMRDAKELIAQLVLETQ
uniref:ARF like GTPase 9 n=2 Tax=Accipitrinae TaxID=8955 RepID=A0A663E148_AQUCH